MNQFIVKVAQMVKIDGKYYAFDRSAASVYDYWYRTKIGSSVRLVRTKVNLNESISVTCLELKEALDRQRTIRQYELLRKQEEIRYGLLC